MALYYANEIIQTPPSSVPDSITLQNAIFDEVFVSEDVNFDAQKEITYFPDEWSDDVVLHATFQGSIVAGGIMFEANEDSGFYIKRRPVSEVLWTTIGYSNGSDFVLNGNMLNGIFIDRTAIPNDDYEYMIVPVLYGQEITGISADNIVHCWTDGIAISEKDKTYYTILEIKLSNDTQNEGSTIIKTLNGEFPYSFKNGASNYITGSAQGLFAPTSDGCEYIYDNEKYNNVAWKYREEFRKWLCNGKIKTLKYYDGRTRLVAINGTVSDDDGEHNYKNITSFNFTQVGDVKSTTDLIESGLMDNY